VTARRTLRLPHPAPVHRPLDGCVVVPEADMVVGTLPGRVALYLHLVPLSLRVSWCTPAGIGLETATTLARDPKHLVVVHGRNADKAAKVGGSGWDPCSCAACEALASLTPWGDCRVSAAEAWARSGFACVGSVYAAAWPAQLDAASG
jgi:hypothetical protein